MSWACSNFHGACLLIRYAEAFIHERGGGSAGVLDNGSGGACAFDTSFTAHGRVCQADLELNWFKYGCEIDTPYKIARLDLI